MRPIDADALDFTEYLGWDEPIICKSKIDAAPTLDVAPVHGRWVDVDDGIMIGDGHHTECSNCNTWDSHREKRAFCPNCGAHMDKED